MPASRRIVPSPLPVLTGMVQTVPAPLGAPIDAPLTPTEVARENDAAVTPLTGSLNVTVKLTLAAFVGFASARAIEVTVGAVVSTTIALRLAMFCPAGIVSAQLLLAASRRVPAERIRGLVALR